MMERIKLDKHWMMGLWAVVCVGYMGLAGCGPKKGAGSVERTEGVPAPFWVEVRTSEPDALRYAFHRIEADGSMVFAGGRNAVEEHAKVIGKTSPEERRRVWAVIQEHNLMEADGTMLGLGDGAVRYQIEIQAGAASNKIRSRAANAEGLAALDEVMNDIRTRIRTEAVMGPVQSEMEKERLKSKSY